MSHPVVIAENLAKAYRLGTREKRHDTFRDLVSASFGAPLRLFRKADDDAADDTLFWALRDVSLDVHQGEVVGIIGRNGAGKSTLLKILSRITEPTSGSIRLRGRVASLLEVGTGFHPELTGGENVFLNGALLGMKRAEIRRKFDEIVAFADIEQFLDTPVKRYSSGMYVRLAFAVAAHLEPEILIVDEVLAVGDHQFQKKCIGKMRDVSLGDGRTVLFVSHNMAAVRSLCRTGVVLEKGHIAFRGNIEDAIQHYMRPEVDESADSTVVFRTEQIRGPRMLSARILCGGKLGTRLEMGDSLAIEVEFAHATSLAPRIGLVISTMDGIRILGSNNRYQPTEGGDVSATHGRVACDLGVVPLVAGTYAVSLWFGDMAHDSHVEEGALSFEVVERDIWGLGRVPASGDALEWWPTRFMVEALEQPAP